MLCPCTQRSLFKGNYKMSPTTAKGRGRGVESRVVGCSVCRPYTHALSLHTAVAGFREDFTKCPLQLPRRRPWCRIQGSRPPCLPAIHTCSVPAHSGHCLKEGCYKMSPIAAQRGGRGVESRVAGRRVCRPYTHALSLHTAVTV
jgi:hypothetical protein